MRNIYISLLLFALTLSVSGVKAQQVFFSQYQYSPTFSNIGMTANVDYTRAGVYYRSMSLAEGNIMHSSAFSLIHPLHYKDNDRRFGALNLSVGDIRTGVRGVNRNTHITGGFTYNLNLDARNSVGVGLQGSYYMRASNLSEVHTPKMFVDGRFDPLAESGEDLADQANSYGVNLGATWVNNDAEGHLKFFAGVSAFDLGSGGSSYSGADLNTPYSIIGNAGLSLFKAGQLHVIPMARWIYYNSLNIIDGTLLTRYYFGTAEYNNQGHVGLGLGYRNNSIAVISMEYDRSQYTLGASFDMPVSNTGDGLAPNNALEVSFVWKGWKKRFRPKVQLPVDVPAVAITEDSVQTDTMMEDLVQQDSVEADTTTMDIAQVEPVEVDTVDYSTGDKPTQPQVEIVDVSQKKDELAGEDSEEKSGGNWYPKGKHPYYDEAVELEDIQLNFHLSQHHPSTLLEELQEIANLLKSDKSLILRVSGHACTLGNKEYNKKLSLKRAEQLKQKLLKLGVSGKQVVTIGYGSEHPKADNSTEEGRKINRRVEFDLLQKIVD